MWIWRFAVVDGGSFIDSNGPGRFCFKGVMVVVVVVVLFFW